MTRKRYGDEFKEQVLREYEEIGNAALVARRHETSKQTVYAWIKAKKKTGSVKPLPREHMTRLQEAERRLETVNEDVERHIKLTRKVRLNCHKKPVSFGRK
jgi:transposase-like protein